MSETHDTRHAATVEKDADDYLNESTANLRKTEALMTFLEDFIDDLDIGIDGRTRAAALIEATQATLTNGIEQLKAAHTLVLKSRVKS